MDPEETAHSVPPQDAALEVTDDEQPFADYTEEDQPQRTGRHWGITIVSLVTTALALLIGLGMGYLLWGTSTATVMPVIQTTINNQLAAAGSPLKTASSGPTAVPTQGPAPAPVLTRVLATLPQSYMLPISYGALGLQLVKAGVIDLPAFVQVFAAGGNPLTTAQQAIVRDGSNSRVTIDRKNAHFLLNFFWAVGLANRNSLVLKGPLQQNSEGKIEQFASTGGWTLASKPIKEIVGAVPLFNLTEAQQKRLEAVAGAVYRPCCGNSTAFPDCNHGMAMLGVLELMAANNASEEQMFTAAKFLNTFWFPQQMAEAAGYFKLTQNLDYLAIDPRRMVSREIASGSGFQQVHQWLAANAHLGAPSGNGASCGA